MGEASQLDLQARADEILRAHERHTAEIERLKAELGMDIAEARVKELVEQFSQIGRQIENTQAVTIDGIRAKAEVIGRACWSGTIPRDNDGTDQRLLASIVADLTGLPDEQPYDPDLAADQVELTRHHSREGAALAALFCLFSIEF